uniref:Uncharacterized protein n=1 Tax=Knipowitschia caucasica TaxID=637954 RepID=A0AAV2LTM0_KNICA
MGICMVGWMGGGRGVDSGWDKGKGGGCVSGGMGDVFNGGLFGLWEVGWGFDCGGRGGVGFVFCKGLWFWEGDVWGWYGGMCWVIEGGGYGGGGGFVWVVRGGMVILVVYGGGCCVE